MKKKITFSFVRYPFVAIPYARTYFRISVVPVLISIDVVIYANLLNNLTVIVIKINSSNSVSTAKYNVYCVKSQRQFSPN